MNVAIPAPGGSVTPLRFGVMALGGAAGIYGFNTYVLPNLPPAAISWSLGPIPGYVVWYAGAALLGGAAGSMAYSRFGGKA